MKFKFHDLLQFLFLSSKRSLPVLLVMLLSFGSIQMVKAEFSTLQPCNESSAFQKQQVFSLKKLENRLKLYTPESREAFALINKIESTKRRFKIYGNSTLLCGKEGLPRIIAGGSFNHANEFIFPGLLFIYISGWIGWVGRKYIREINKTSSDYESEIIINVPLAVSIMPLGFIWPLDAIKEFAAGELIAPDEDITVSPR